MPDDNSLNWRTWRWETIGSYALLAVVLVAAILLLGDELEDHVKSFESWLAGLGPGALVMAVVLYAACAVVFIPDTLLGLAAGATFGFTHGLLVALLGSVLAAIAEYSLSLRLLKPLIDRRLARKPDLQAIQAAVKTQEFKLQFLIRMTPINRSLTSYLLGASGVRFQGFIVAAASLPGGIRRLCRQAPGRGNGTGKKHGRFTRCAAGRRLAGDNGSHLPDFEDCKACRRQCGGRLASVEPERAREIRVVAGVVTPAPLARFIPAGQ